MCRMVFNCTWIYAQNKNILFLSRPSRLWEACGFTRDLLMPSESQRFRRLENFRMKPREESENAIMEIACGKYSHTSGVAISGSSNWINANMVIVAAMVNDDISNRFVLSGLGSDIITSIVSFLNPSHTTTDAIEYSGTGFGTGFIRPRMGSERLIVVSQNNLNVVFYLRFTSDTSRLEREQLRVLVQ